jgi:hypothetical protein
MSITGIIGKTSLACIYILMSARNPDCIVQKYFGIVSVGGTVVLSNTRNEPSMALPGDIFTVPCRKSLLCRMFQLKQKPNLHRAVGARLNSRVFVT